jgi:DNA-binding GntR family transcriptional regulator
MSAQAEYLRIQADVQRRVDAGEWQPGTRLPTQAELAAQYSVSVQPIKAALSRLEVLGVIIQRRGGSAIVAPHGDSAEVTTSCPAPP